MREVKIESVWVREREGYVWAQNCGCVTERWYYSIKWSLTAYIKDAWERLFVCVREVKSVCVRERERKAVIILKSDPLDSLYKRCMREIVCVCLWVRDGEIVCVWKRERWYYPEIWYLSIKDAWYETSCKFIQ